MKIIRYWLLPIIWMTIIFAFSSRQRVSVSDEYVLNFLFFKTLHVIEYAVLFFFLFRAIYSTKHNQSFFKDALLQSAIIAILYAASDEIHQLFVPTREGTVRDLLIDCVGIFLMYSYIKNNIQRLKQLLY